MSNSVVGDILLFFVLFNVFPLLYVRVASGLFSCPFLNLFLFFLPKLSPLGAHKSQGSPRTGVIESCAVEYSGIYGPCVLHTLFSSHFLLPSIPALVTSLLHTTTQHPQYIRHCNCSSPSSSSCVRKCLLMVFREVVLLAHNSQFIQCAYSVTPRVRDVYISETPAHDEWVDLSDMTYD